MGITNKILIIDDNVNFLNDVEALLRKKFKIIKALNGKQGIEYLQKHFFSALLLDLKLPDVKGLEILKTVKSSVAPDLPVIIVTDYGDVSTAVEAIKLGADDFIQKDFDVEVLCQKIINALEKRDLLRNLRTLKEEQDEKYTFIFQSKEMERINYEIEKIALYDYDVLLLGESGVGKDIVAREIHKRSKRKDKLFVSVPLVSLNESLIESELFGYEKGAFSGADRKIKIGKFEGANNGTIYLPEISKLNENIQLKLLQFMQYKTISRVGRDGRENDIHLNVRVILATNDNLEDLIEAKKIREDFYYRISAIKINIPPLRERKDDIEILTRYFINKHKIKYGKMENYNITKEAIEKLKKYNWPGNVRELENQIVNALTFSNNSVLDTDSFNLPNNKKGINNYLNDDYKTFEIRFKREYFLNILKKTNGNKTKAAKLAGFSRQGLFKILKELEIE